MVAQLFGLRLALLGNLLKGSPSRAFGIVVGLLALVAAVLLVAMRVIAVGGGDPQSARTTIVISGSVIVLAFAVAPLLVQRDDPLDPRRFSLLGIAPGVLSIALPVTAFASIPVVAATLFAVSTVAAWAHGPLVLLLAVVGAALAVATCVLAGLLASSLAAFVLSSRRSREVAGVVAIFILVLLAPAIVLALSIDWGDAGATWSQNLAQVLGFTPLGAAWALPAAAANDDAGAAFLSFVVAALTVAVLWFAWRALVAVMLTTTSRAESGLDAVGLGWFARLPSTPAGSIAARSFTYWARDPRYYVPLIIVPVVPIVMAIPLVLVEFPLTVYALIPLPVMCLFLGFSVHNDVALDNSAIWLHIVSGRRGLADRVGRIAPVLMVGLPLIGIGSVVTVLLAGNSAALPAVLGVSTCLLFSALGLGSLISARFPYAATRPGDSPFTQPQTIGSTSVMVQLAVVAGTLALTLPSLGAGILGLMGPPGGGDGGDGLYWVSLWWGVGVGVVVLVVGSLGGGVIFSRRGPEVMQVSLRS